MKLSIPSFLGPATEKKVRFDTQQNQTISMTPTMETDINDGEITPLSSHDKSKKLNKSRKSFDSLKCSLSFLKTPQTAGRQSRTTVETQHNVAQTPMALRYNIHKSFLDCRRVY